MTTLHPRPPYSDAELQQLYPPRLHLQQVQILLRHGERTPINARFTNTGLPAYWPYCNAVRHLRSAVLGPSGPGPESGSGNTFTELQWRRRLETFGTDDAAIPATGPDDAHKIQTDGICDFGMLTDRGRETTHALGSRLRKLYIDQLDFLPASVHNADFLYLRATPLPRALESMQQAFLGLYPPHTRAADFPPLTIITRSPADETLFPNDGVCRRFAALSRAFANRAAERWNDSPEMAYLTKKLGKYMPDESPRVAVDAKPRLSGLMDTINSTLAHGPATRLPKDFYDPKARAIMDKIVVDEWFAGYKESEEYRTLAIGALLGDLTARMVSSAERNVSTPDEAFVQPPGQDSLEQAPKSRSTSDFRFGLSGCHDTTLAGILSSLGAFNTDKWPPYTSHVAIELFRDSENTTTTPSSSSSWLPSFLRPSSSSPSIGRTPTPNLTDKQLASLQGYFVRLRYNDEPVAIPGCKLPGNHLPGDESFCTLAAFKAIVDKFTPRDWKQQCGMNLKASAFPQKPEPAGF
ncbi:histidine phosphatase superfamily [Trichoderma sp. SZMC 28014]